MQIVRDTFKDNYKNLQSLFEKHWEEIGMVGSNGKLELNLNVNYYLDLEAKGQLLCMGLKNDEGRYVGYLDYIIYDHYHHTGSAFAYTDAFIIDKEYRTLNGFKTVLKMFKDAEKILKEEFNVGHIQMVFSVGNDLSRLAQRLGYRDSDILMVKALEG